MMNTNSDEYDYSRPFSPDPNDLVFSGEVIFHRGVWTTITLDKAFIYEGEDMTLIVNDKTGTYTPDHCYFDVYNTDNTSFLICEDDNSFNPFYLDEYTFDTDIFKSQIRLSNSTTPKPSNLELTDMTNESFTMTWTENGGATEWEVEYSVDETFKSQVQAQREFSTESTIFGIIPETTYYFRVRSILGENTYSDWSKTIAIDFTSKVTIGSDEDQSGEMPIKVNEYYSISQQIYTAEELGWENQYKWIEAIDFKLRSGANATRNIDIYIYNTTKDAFEDKEDWMHMPDDALAFSGRVQLNSTGWLTIKLDKPIEYEGDNIILTVYDKTGRTASFRNFSTFHTDNNQALYLTSGSELDPRSFSDEAEDNPQEKNHIRILFNRGEMICPSALELTDQTHNSGTVSWKENGNSNSWTLEYSTDSRFVNNLQSIDIEGTPTATLSNLTPETEYFVRVKSVDGWDSSNWSNTLSFTPTNKAIIGSEMSANEALPLNNFFKYSLSQQIYTTEEIGAAHLGDEIETIDFKSIDGTTKNRKIDIYMVNTDQESFGEAIPVTDEDLVFSGEVYFEAGRWTTITLDKQFLFQGNNLAVIVNDRTGNFWGESQFVTFVTETYQSIFVYNDDSEYDPTSTDGYVWYQTGTKNHIRLGFENKLYLDDTMDQNEDILAADNDVYNVILMRHVKEGVNTMVLPFEFTTDDAEEYFGGNAKIYVVAGLKSYNDNYSISFERCNDAVDANRPFLLVSSEEVDVVDFGKRKIIAPATESPCDAAEGISLIGTYDIMNLNADNGYYVVSNSMLYKVTTDVEVRPTRAFFQLTADQGDVKELNIVFNDDEATSVIDIASGTVAPKGIYDLSGRKVSKMAKGMYIVDGKKVISR